MIDNCSFELGPRGIHVWTLTIDASEALAAQFEPVLAPDEKDRAARFRSDRLRHSFVITRGALRHLLGRYLNLPPASLRFRCGSNGKPALASRASLEFNATHSDTLAAFAFTAGCEIGIDLERVRPLPEAEDIADRLFCAEEAAELRSLAPSERERAFFCCWTRKEAYIKAIADGLSARLDSFRVTLQPDVPARFVYVQNDLEDAKGWTLHDLRFAPDYAAALAYRDSRRSLSIYPVMNPRELVSVSIPL